MKTRIDELEEQLAAARAERDAWRWLAQWYTSQLAALQRESDRMREALQRVHSIFINVSSDMPRFALGRTVTFAALAEPEAGEKEGSDDAVAND